MNEQDKEWMNDHGMHLGWDEEAFETNNSISAKRERHSEPICLDGKLIINKKEELEEMTMEDVCKKILRLKI